MADNLKNLYDIEDNFTWKAERQQRIRIITTLLPAMIGILLISIPEYIDLPFPFSNSIFQLLVPFMFLLSVTSFLMMYLQTGFKKSNKASIEYMKYENELAILKNKIENNEFISFPEIEKIKEELSQIKQQSNNNSISNAITVEQRDELVSILKAELIDKSKDKAAEEILAEIEDRVKSTNQLKEVENVFTRTLERLYEEINALSRRGNLNLSLGILTTIIGLGILGYFVLEIHTIPEDKMAFLAHFIPRLSLVILIEVFAYFFLKLYKSSLSEIKYFQNEMTNSEAKLIAIKCSIMTSDAATKSVVIQALSNTERNSILEKNQTTAEIEKLKIEHQNISTISEKVSNLLCLKK